MKLNKKFPSDKTITMIIYSLAALVVMSVIVLSVFALASGRRDGSAQTAASERAAGTAKPSTSASGSGTKTPGTLPPVTEAEKGDEPATVIVDQPLKLIAPCEGLPGKVYDIENLGYSLTMNDLRTHSGLDITANEGDAVVACADGKVSAVYDDYMMGSCVEITHRDGFVSVYRNLAPELEEGIAEGCAVKSGDRIGSVGCSAMAEQADQPHLHFELKVDGKTVDPLDYISFDAETMAPAYED